MELESWSRNGVVLAYGGSPELTVCTFLDDSSSSGLILVV